MICKKASTNYVQTPNYSWFPQYSTSQGASTMVLWFLMSFVVNLSYLVLNLMGVNIIPVPDSMSAAPPAPPALLAAVPGYPPQQGSNPVTGSLPV